jgi:hypothetical protein
MPTGKQTLENPAVLTVHGQHRHPGLDGGRHHQPTGTDQRLFVRQRDRRAKFDSLERRSQAGRPDHRAKHDIRPGRLQQRDHRLVAGIQLHILPQGGTQILMMLLLHNRHMRHLDRASLLGHLPPVVAGGQGAHRRAGGLGQHLQRLPADAAGGTKNRQCGSQNSVLSVAKRRGIMADFSPGCNRPIR